MGTRPHARLAGVERHLRDGDASWKVKFTGLTQNSQVDPEV
jgi:hypothetical protein